MTLKSWTILFISICPFLPYQLYKIVSEYWALNSCTLATFYIIQILHCFRTMWFGSVEVASVPSWRVLFAICDSGKKVLQLRHFQVNIILHWQLQSDSISQRIREVHTNDHTRLRNTSNHTPPENTFSRQTIAMMELYLYRNLSLRVKYYSWYHKWEGVFSASETVHWIFHCC